VVEKSVYSGIVGVENGGYYGSLEGGFVAGEFWKGGDGQVVEKVVSGK
jgi:hypothetical protein